MTTKQEAFDFVAEMGRGFSDSQFHKWKHSLHGLTKYIEAQPDAETLGATNGIVSNETAQKLDSDSADKAPEVVRIEDLKLLKGWRGELYGNPVYCDGFDAGHDHAIETIAANYPNGVRIVKED